MNQSSSLRMSTGMARRSVAAAAIQRTAAVARPVPTAQQLRQRVGNGGASALIARSMASPMPSSSGGSAGAGSSPRIADKCACGGTCEDCKSAASKVILRAAASTTTAPDGVHYAGLSQHAQSGGRPLDRVTHAFMASRFGRTFDSVRVHTDSFASRQASALNASAFTIGQDVFFGSGQYRPESRGGRRLIAHELTHTVQQGGRASVSDATGSPLAVSHPTDALEREAVRVADQVVDGTDSIHVQGRKDGAQIDRDVLTDFSLPSVQDLRRGGQAALNAGAGLLQQGAQAVQSVAGAALEWIATEGGQLALAEANALASLFGGSVIIRRGCLVITIPELRIFPSFQKTLAESPPVGFFYPLISGGVMIGPVPVAGMAGLLGYAQLSAEAAVGPGVVRGITFEICPFKRRALAMAQLYAATAIAPRLTLFGGAFGAVGTVIPFEPPIPLVLIAQAGLRGTGTGWAIGAIEDTVQVEYRGGGLHFSNIAELKAGYLLTGDLDFFAALRIFSKVICQYVHPIKHWQTGRAWKLTVPISASYGRGGGTGGVGPITWGRMPIEDIETAIRPLPAGWNCLTWEEVKRFLCEIGVIPKSLCEDADGTEPEILRQQLALAICKCVGEQKCGGGRIYRRCFEVSDAICKDRGKLQKAADDKCNNTPEMAERCRRPECYYRHTDAKCPVKKSECKDGYFPSGAGPTPKTDECPVPVDFRQTSVSDVGGGTLHFKYAWDSSTGYLGDLRNCGITEKVDYPNGNPFRWPSPPWDGRGTPNPTIEPSPPIPGDRGKAVDNHSTLGFKKPYKRASFTANQVYRYTTPCKNAGKPIAMSRNIAIVRTVTQNADGTFKYRITKSGSSAEINPLP